MFSEYTVIVGTYFKIFKKVILKRFPGFGSWSFSLWQLPYWFSHSFLLLSKGLKSLMIPSCHMFHILLSPQASTFPSQNPQFCSIKCICPSLTQSKVSLTHCLPGWIMVVNSQHSVDLDNDSDSRFQDGNFFYRLRRNGLFLGYIKLECVWRSWGMGRWACSVESFVWSPSSLTQTSSENNPGTCLVKNLCTVSVALAPC